MAAKRHGPGWHCYGSCERIGRRSTMEDAIACVPRLHAELQVEDLDEAHLAPDDKAEGVQDKDMAFFGVFDGHGGRACAAFAAQAVPALLARLPQRAAVTGKALIEAHLRCDDLLRNHLQTHFADSKEFNSGTTATSVALEWCKASAAPVLTCANVGDSRCVVVTADGGCVPLTEDHAPTLQRERERIEATGGFISTKKFGNQQERVLGALAVTRALGDFDFKMPRVSSWGTSASPITSDVVIAEPEIRRYVCSPQDVAVVIACDGIWNVFSNEEAASFVHSRLQKLQGVMSKSSAGERCELVATALVEVAITRKSQDNCSCVVVLLAQDAKSTVCTVS